ncbi:MAG: alpha/beta hydrolase [Candidatus Lokiarchaeota archaeon]|nr:alpha/beta hydrolase [Candidatus Lokiarchaeota archaeon]
MVTSRDFEARRGRAAPYEIYKPSDGETGLPVMFIHGWRSSPAMFHDLVACLDHGSICCILPHLASDASRRHDSSSRTPHLAALDLIDELHVDRLGIVAFGMFGGSIARHVIRELGYHRFAFVSLLSPGPCIIDSPAREAFWNMLPVETRAKILDLSPGALDAMVQKAVDLFDVRGSTASREGLYDDLHSMAEEILALGGAARKKHRTCIVPVEVICGELDEVIPLELSFKTVRDFGEVNVSVIPLAGHHFVAEFYEETAECMREFLDERVERVMCSQRALP